MLTYFALTTALLLGLAFMILQIGRALGECPQKGRAARAASVTIATGFVAIGMGGVSLIASFLAMMDGQTACLLLSLGLASLILGLGFTHAVTLLRAAVLDAPVPMEPVLG